MMPKPEKGRAVLPELQNISPIERARFVARNRAAGLTMEVIGGLLGISAQRAGQLLKRYSHDPVIQAMRDVGSAIELHRKGVAALAELVDLGLAVAREAAADPAVERKEKAAIVAAAVGPAHRLAEGAEKVLRRHQIGAIASARQAFDHQALLDSVSAAVRAIKQLPVDAQPAAREVLTASLRGSKTDQAVIDVEPLAPDAGPDGDNPPISPF